MDDRLNALTLVGRIGSVHFEKPVRVPFPCSAGPPVMARGFPGDHRPGLPGEVHGEKTMKSADIVRNLSAQVESFPELSNVRRPSA